MEVISLGIEAVWSAQRYSRELNDSVWSVFFYEHLLDVLENDTWRHYPSEAFGRTCQFDKLSDFLTNPDGLGWPAVPQVLEMIQIVSKCSPPPQPRQNEPADPPITKWAEVALKALEPHVTVVSAVAEQAQPLAEHGTTKGKLRDPETGLFLAAQEAESLAEHGGTAKAQAIDARGSDRTSGLRGETQAYLLRRIARDAPEILERVKAGEFKSARAAAIEAGIIKPVPTVRLVSDINAIAAKLCQHLTSDQRIALAEALLQENA